MRLGLVISALAFVLSAAFGVFVVSSGVGLQVAGSPEASVSLGSCSSGSVQVPLYRVTAKNDFFLSRDVELPSFAACTAGYSDLYPYWTGYSQYLSVGPNSEETAVLAASVVCGRYDASGKLVPLTEIKEILLVKSGERYPSCLSLSEEEKAGAIRIEVE